MTLDLPFIELDGYAVEESEAKALTPGIFEPEQYDERWVESLSPETQIRARQLLSCLRANRTLRDSLDSMLTPTIETRADPNAGCSPVVRLGMLVESYIETMEDNDAPLVELHAPGLNRLGQVILQLQEEQDVYCYLLFTLAEQDG